MADRLANFKMRRARALDGSCNTAMPFARDREVVTPEAAEVYVTI